jgi:type VI protein secretion system component VasK
MPGSKTPELKFFVTFSDLDSNADRFVLQIDGQNLDDKHLKQPASWPGPCRDSTSTFEPLLRSDSRGGPWAGSDDRRHRALQICSSGFCSGSRIATVSA